SGAKLCPARETPGRPSSCATSCAGARLSVRRLSGPRQLSTSRRQSLALRAGPPRGEVRGGPALSAAPGSVEFTRTHRVVTLAGLMAECCRRLLVHERLHGCDVGRRRVLQDVEHVSPQQRLP